MFTIYVALLCVQDDHILFWESGRTGASMLPQEQVRAGETVPECAERQWRELSGEAQAGQLIGLEESFLHGAPTLTFFFRFEPPARWPETLLTEMDVSGGWRVWIPAERWKTFHGEPHRLLPLLGIQPPEFFYLVRRN